MRGSGTETKTMFFEKNKNLLIGTGAVALLWVILYYVLVSPNWAEAQKSEETAETKRKAWVESTDALAEKKAAEKAHRTNKFLTKAEAEKELDANSAQTELRMKELRKIEFGNHESLKPFSVAAAGAGGDANSLLNTRSKEAIQRLKAIMPKDKDKIADDLFMKSGDASVALSLLRLALIDRFLSACKEVKDVNTKECKIEQLVQVEYYSPILIPVPPPEDEKKEKEEDDGEMKKPAKHKKGEKDEEKPDETFNLVQIPMKVLVRGPERYINQLLLELAQPTPPHQEGDDKRGYFSIRGFHVTTRETLPNSVELSVAVSALMQEREVKALKVGVKTDMRGGNEKDPFGF